MNWLNSIDNEWIFQKIEVENELEENELEENDDLNYNRNSYFEFVDSS